MTSFFGVSQHMCALAVKSPGGRGIKSPRSCRVQTPSPERGTESVTWLTLILRPSGLCGIDLLWVLVLAEGKVSLGFHLFGCLHEGLLNPVRLEGGGKKTSQSSFLILLEISVFI